MIGRIDAAARIPVDVPGAAEFVVLLDNGVGDAEPAKRDAKRDGANPCADDQDVLLLQLLARRLLCPAHIARNESHFLAHQRRVFRRDVFAEAGVHHFQHQLIAGIGDRRPRLAVREKFEHGGADFILDFLGHTGFGIRDQADVAPGLVRRFQPTEVSGHMNQNH